MILSKSKGFPFRLLVLIRFKELKKRRKEKEENEFNEYIKDTMENEKDKSNSSLNSG